MQVLSEKSDFMRIRRYIVNTILAHSPKPVKFPPLQRLADKFGVSKPTVLRVVRSLIDQRFLEPCKGGGTISIPMCSLRMGEHKVFGVITASGTLCFEALYFNRLNAAIKNEICLRDASFATLQISYGVMECLEKAILDSAVDCLALVSPDELMFKQLSTIKKTGLPVVSFMHKLEGIPSVYRALGDLCAKSLEALFAEGRRKILFFAWPFAYYAPDIEGEIAAVCAAAGVPGDSVSLYYTGDFQSTERTLSELSARLAAGEKFDGAVFYPFSKEIYLLLTSKLDIKRECRLILDESSVTRDLGFTGYVFHQDMAGAAAKAVDLLLQPPSSPQHVKLDIEISKDSSPINARSL